MTSKFCLKEKRYLLLQFCFSSPLLACLSSQYFQGYLSVYKSRNFVLHPIKWQIAKHNGASWWWNGQCWIGQIGKSSQGNENLIVRIQTLEDSFRLPFRKIEQNRTTFYQWVIGQERQVFLSEGQTYILVFQEIQMGCIWPYSCFLGTISANFANLGNISCS